MDTILRSKMEIFVAARQWRYCGLRGSYGIQAGYLMADRWLRFIMRIGILIQNYAIASLEIEKYYSLLV